MKHDDEREDFLTRPLTGKELMNVSRNLKDLETMRELRNSLSFGEEMFCLLLSLILLFGMSILSKYTLDEIFDFLAIVGGIIIASFAIVVFIIQRKKK